MESLLVQLLAKFGVFAISGIILLLIGKNVFKKYNSLIDNLQTEKKELESRFQLSEKEHLDYMKQNAADHIRTLDSNREAFKQMTAAFDRNSEVTKELVELLLLEHKHRKFYYKKKLNAPQS